VVVAMALSTAGALPLAARSAAIPLPPPGSSAQVAALVAAATSIRALPGELAPALADAPSNRAGNLYPVTRNGCAGTSKCVLGDTASPRTMVLYGDSHAQMWLPALVPIARAAHVRLVTIWTSDCPVVSIATSTVGGCKKFRTDAIAAITRLKPALVVLGERTTAIAGPRGTVITGTAWRSGLAATIRAVASAVTKVAVLGDVTQFNGPVPSCLASYPTDVQHCTVGNPNPRFSQKFAAEREAALATGAAYLNARSWLCTSKCAPVIGNMVAYSDFGHVTATYAEYLTTVVAAAIDPLLKP
jgi:hypothetical protein